MHTVGSCSGTANASRVDGHAALATLVEPFSASRFLAEYWNKQFVHVPGAADKFDRLFSWQQLNETLELHRFGRTRVRLIQKDRTIDPAAYQYPSKTQECLLRPAAVRAHLRDGATLVVNKIEESCRPLRSFIEALEALFKVNVNANLYAGFGHDQGFVQHWDPQDTFIVQIAGRKAWSIWLPTRWQPLQPDVREAPRPQGPPVWDGELTQGSLFYIPRGWWHVAQPLDEPCLHLTITVNNKPGLDLLSRLFAHLPLYDVVRQDVPFAGDAREQQDYVERLKGAVVEFLASSECAGLADAYLREEKSPRPRFSLPTLVDDE